MGEQGGVNGGVDGGRRNLSIPVDMRAGSEPGKRREIYVSRGASFSCYRGARENLSAMRTFFSRDAAPPEAPPPTLPAPAEASAAEAASSTGWKRVASSCGKYHGEGFARRALPGGIRQEGCGEGIVVGSARPVRLRLA